MNTFARTAVSAFVVIFALSSHAIFADVAAISNVKTSADLDALIASTADAKLKQALHDSSAAILAAAEQRPHVLAVIATIDLAPGKVEKINVTPEGLKQAAGGDIPLFETLKLVDLSVPGMGPHDHRKADPYDAVFFEHLGHIPSLESINVISTKANDEWIAPIGKLVNLKKLSFTNNGKLTDAGLESLAGLKQLENFAYIGTEMKGHGFAKWDVSTKLTRSSFRGSSLDDEGLRLLCEKFPNYESISLAHAKFTDAGAVNLAKLTKLKGLEIASHNATPAALKNVANLPLEYLQLGEGFDSPEAIALIKDIKTLKRLTVTDAKTLKDDDLKSVAAMTHLESLEFSNLEIPDERMSLMQSFSFLKAFRLVHRPPYPTETQAKLKALMPKTAFKFE
jgi:hypothetical protein